jgi:hypothetical protein
VGKDIWAVAAEKGMLQHGAQERVLSVSAGKRIKFGNMGNAHDQPRLSETGYKCIQYYSRNLETLYRYLRTHGPVVDCKTSSDRLLIVLGHGRHQDWGLHADKKKKTSKSAIAQGVYDAAGPALDVVEAGGVIGLGVFLVAYPAVLLVQKGLRRKSKYKWWVRVVLRDAIPEIEWQDTVAIFKAQSNGGKVANLRGITEVLPLGEVKHHSVYTASAEDVRLEDD